MSSVASPHIPPVVPRSECIRPPSDASRSDDHCNAPLSRHMLFSRWPGNTPFHEIQDAGHRCLSHCQAHRNGLYSTDDLSFYPRQTPFITRRVASVTGPKCLLHLHSAFLPFPYLIRCSDYVYNVKCVQFGKKTPWPAFFVYAA